MPSRRLFSVLPKFSFALIAFAPGLFGLQLVADDIEFNRDVLPILSDHCFQCHGPDSATREADLRLDRETEVRSVIVPSEPDSSELIRRIFSDDSSEVMPPPEARRKLSDQEKQTLRQWITLGAKWEQHWAFKQPVRPDLPEVKQTSWPINGIDYFILQRLEQAGLQPSPEASREKLIRRVTLDLTGLPPTPDEVAEFVADKRVNAYEHVVDRLLKSPRYGETMALPWLEAARFADTDGYQYDGPRFMWRWRDWVIDAYNQHMPFDQFTIEQLAGDLLPNPTLKQRIATGFNRNHRYNSESGLVVEEFLLENAVDRVDTTSTVWLGLTMGCARCHDHKYDPVSQKDYYQMIAFFNNVPEAGRALKIGNSEPYIVAPTDPQEDQLREFDRAVEIAHARLNSDPVRTAQIEWERQVLEGHQKVDKPLVKRGLQHHFSFNGQLPDRAKAESGKATYDDGFFSQALVLDGKTVISVPNVTVNAGKEKKKDRFGNFSCNTKYSVAFWLRPEKIENGVVISRQNKSMARKGMSLELRDGHLVFSVISRWIAGAGVVQTKDKLKAGEWVHVVVSNDGSHRATEQKIYLNGVRVPVQVILNTNSNSGGAGKNDPLRIGGGPHGPPFTGIVDDLQIYSRELRPQEIQPLAEKESVTKIAEIKEAKRTETQAAKIRAWFLEHGPLQDRYQQYVQALTARDKFVAKLPTSMVMVENPAPKPTFVRVRGVYHQLGERVKRDTPAVLPPLPTGYQRNRLGFAKWLVSGDNPLTARVAVNRYWQKYFGVGLVKTSEDFGVQGEKPTHPELLDRLATEFVQTGWDVAGMQKRIVMSATYRQTSSTTPELLKRDPENRLLARGPRLRLAGPVLRDQALFVSGLLVEKVGGPSVSPYQPPNLWIEMSMGRRYRPSKGADLFRRSLYTVWKRTVNPPSMAILDAADREACWVGVKRTNTPLQALTLLNETAFVESARHLAARMMREGHDDPIEFGFRVVTARIPNAKERKILENAFSVYLAEYQSNRDAANKLIATGTTPVAKDLDPVRLAAFTALANVLLNLDEVVTNE